MSTDYTKDQVLYKVEEWLKPEKVSQLYAQPFINYTGFTSNNNEKYTEVIAANLLDNINMLEEIKTITRQNSYNVSHKKKEIDPLSPRSEEQTARSMMGETYDYIGKIIDYQTPLKDVQADVAGKIDLLAWNKEKACAYILEFKMPESKETLLRCVLEAYTYWRIVDSEKLLRDFNIPASTTLRKAVLVHQDSLPHNSFSDPKIARLVRTLCVNLFVLDNSGKKVVEAHFYEQLQV